MKHSLNLMSLRSRKREQVRHCLRIWSRALVAVLAVLSLGGFAKWRVCHQEVERQASAAAEYEPIRQLRLESTRLREQIEALQSSERIPLALANHQPLLSLIGLATQAVAEQDGRVYLRHMEIEREPLPLESTRQPALTFALAGSGNDSGAITRVADSLRNVGPFAAVELTTNKNPAAGGPTEQSFSIQCTN